MDDRRFDMLARGLAAGNWSRRRLSHAFTLSALAVVLGWDRPEARAKKKRKKRRKTTLPSRCTPNCTGNEICVNGACVCPPGMKRCEGPGIFMPCHECCPSEFCTFCPHRDCGGNPKGQFCETNHADFVFRCGCWGEKTCGGLCGRCCDNVDCLTDFGTGSLCTQARTCACEEGLTYCSRELGCRDVSRDRDACGPICKLCPPGFACVNGACCTNECGTVIIPGQPCCNGTCAITGGTFDAPEYGCVA